MYNPYNNEKGTEGYFKRKNFEAQKKQSKALESIENEKPKINSVTLENNIVVEYTEPKELNGEFVSTMYYVDFPQHTYFVSASTAKGIKTKALLEFLKEYDYDAMKHI